MKVVGISGSPRRAGNSETLLDKALEGAASKGASVEKIVLNELKLSGCQECGGCNLYGKCVIDDEMQAVFKKIEEADGLLISSPVFFGTVSAQLKAMIDRFQSAWIRKYILKKAAQRKGRKGIFLCVAGAEKDEFFKNARGVVRLFFKTLDVKYAGELFCGGIESVAVKEKKDALRKAFRLGAMIVSA